MKNCRFWINDECRGIHNVYYPCRSEKLGKAPSFDLCHPIRKKYCKPYILIQYKLFF